MRSARHRGVSVIAVDLGGTWIRAARMLEDGSRGELVRIATGRDRVPGDILSDIVASIELAATREEFTAGATFAHGASRATGAPEGIAVGVPTVVDGRGGLVANDNLPTMGGFALAEELERRCGAPVILANDADCFTIGEWRFGAAKGLRNVCGITLGTGIGCSLVLEGRLYTGSHGFAGEIWKSPVGEGTLEDLTCGRSITELYARATGRALDAAEIARRATDGDQAGRDAFLRFGTSLGNTISFLVNALDPDAVVFGGSVALSFSLFLPAVEAAVGRHTVCGQRVALLPSALGDWAALHGAAHLAFERAGRGTRKRTRWQRTWNR